MKRIVVTGGSGAAGRYVVEELLCHDYAVLNLDRVPPDPALSPYTQLDLTDYQAVAAAMAGYDAVIAFGANPNPDFDFATGAERFHNNVLCTYNAFNAAAALGMQRVVWASSETVLGFPFENNRPASVPVDETHAQQPQGSYSLAKVVCEELARHMNRLYDLPIIGLQYSNILFTGTDHPANYAEIPGYWADKASRKFNLWGYIDARDAATAARLALESDLKTADNFIIAAADTIMNCPNAELMEAVFPDVPIEKGTGEYESLLSTSKAQRLLGFTPRYSWRDVISER